MPVRRLTEHDLESLWTLRLRALAESPAAFGTTYDEALAQGNGAMLACLRQTGDDAYYLGAADDTLYGMVRFTRESGAKDRHKGEVSSLYVLPEWRAHGAGRALLRELIATARQLAGLEQLHLAVVTENVAARALYRALGFTTYGTTPHALKLGARYWDEDLMVLFLQ
jgi:ribosomal protein S18 acetylase RimI-like enzyme